MHASLRTTSAQLGEARRTLEALQATARMQSLARQRVANLSRARDEEHKRLMRLEQSHGCLDSSSSGGGVAPWEVELSVVLEKAAATAAITNSNTNTQAHAQAQATHTNGDNSNNSDPNNVTPNNHHTNPNPAAIEAVARELPTSAVLRARAAALRARMDATRQNVAALRGRSADTEAKYRRVVMLCTGVDVGVDVVEDGEAGAGGTGSMSVIDKLLRAVESEKGELELARVRRFLGGVEVEEDGGMGGGGRFD